MFTYRLHFTDGTDAGEATYAVMIKPGEIVHIGGRRYRVIDLVPVKGEDSKYVGFLQVEVA